jgi:hypothetical protein
MVALAGEVVGVVWRRSVAEVLDGHVTLAVDCFDRLYLNGYVPDLHTPGGVVRFLHDHRGNPVPSRRCSPRSVMGSGGRSSASLRPLACRSSGSAAVRASWR